MRREDIPAALKARGLRQADLARFLGKSDHSVSRLVLRQRDFKGDEERRIDQFLKAAEQEGGAGVQPAGRIPLYGMVAASDGDHLGFADDQVMDWIDAPAMARDGGPPMAALRIVGDSMEPRLHAGAVVIAVMGLPPAQGQDCVVEFRDDTAIVKTYQGSRDGYVFVRQLNPDTELRFAWDQVRAVHAVRWRG